MLVPKEVIRPGTYWYTDTDGKPKRLVVDAKFVRHLHDSGNAMLAAGLSVPVPIEHQPDAKPLTKAEQAAQHLRDNAGWVERYYMDGDRLFSSLKIEDAEIAKKLPKTIRWTSPHINSFVDGNGKSWDGVISHVALTSRPRIVNQEPFPSVAAALSLVATLPTVEAGKVNGVVSRAGLLEQSGDTWKPAHQAAFSLWAGAKFDIGDLEKKPKQKADDPDTEGAKPDEVAEEGADKKQTKVPTQDADEPHAVIPSGDGALINDEGMISAYKVVEDALKPIGLDLGTGTDDDFMERLYKAVMDWKQKGTDMADQTQPVPDPKATPPNPIVQETQPTYMSLEQVNAIADPALKATAQMAISVLKRQLADATAARTARVEKLAKRLPAAQRDKLLSLTNVQLSLSAEGTIVDPSAGMLDLLEATAIDVPLALNQRGAGVNLSGATAQPHPHQWGEEMTPERADAVANEFMGNVGLKARPGALTDEQQTALALKLLRRQSA